MTKYIFLKRLSATLQFILGFALGIGLIAGISGIALFTYYKKMSVLPQKPVFPELKVSPEINADTIESSTDIEPLESNTIQDDEEVEATEPPEVPEAPKPASKPEPELPPNAYRGTVTWPQGLSLRTEPNINAGRVGGIEAKANIIILEDSADGKWQRVRLPWSGQEGWVKAGNIKRTSY